jgi:queuosine biosynthesis protein QueD
MGNVIVKKFQFSYAHILPMHAGKCHDLHGHNCELQIGVSGQIVGNSSDAEHGMIADFGRIKRIVKELVVDVLDHKFIAQGNEWPLDVIRLIELLKGMAGDERMLTASADKQLSQVVDRILRQRIPTQIVMIGVPTTAEMMAALTYDILRRVINPRNIGIQLEYVQWYETPDSFALCDLEGWQDRSVQDMLSMARPPWFEKDAELWANVALGNLK